MPREAWNKCCYCGQFISYEDFMERRALGVIEREAAWDGDFIETQTIFHVRCHEAHKELDRIAYEEE